LVGRIGRACGIVAVILWVAWSIPVFFQCVPSIYGHSTEPSFCSIIRSIATYLELASGLFGAIFILSYFHAEKHTDDENVLGRHD
jgi:hypothetical protein